ncbi:hypothetical protein RSAG8_02684, partial [Rhizoctonia solani AG-8 WAC10335]
MFFRQNFPSAKAIHQDVNVALSETLVAALAGRDRAPTPNDKDDPEPLPSRHDVDFIAAGPPCQSFSGANRFKKDNDPRTTMIIAILSAVDHYRPKYFVIENVPNALTSRILGPGRRAGSTDSIETDPSEENYVEQGLLRFITRATLDLGYAVRMGVLQAAEYGAPQYRRRAFILGARHGHTLPEFPLPTYCVRRPETGLHLPTSRYIDPTHEKNGKVPIVGNAIHRQVTMWDAISDLAPFEWVNPHLVIPLTEGSRAEERRRRNRPEGRIPTYVAVKDDRRPETGLHLPTSRYIDPTHEKNGKVPIVGNAIHRQVTMWDAISDLAPFEWVNPHLVIPLTEESRAEDRRRRNRAEGRIPTYVAVKDDRQPVGIGADELAPYRDDSPYTTYQQEARGNENVVSEHYTSSFKSSLFVERVVTIPLTANADHRSLPTALKKGDFLSNIFGSGGASGYYQGAFGRYDKKSPFATILTSLRPAKKNGFCIHPEQKRMLTMREIARAQGFPDYFRFTGTIEQIGNAVVIQVARAIGTEIKKAMIKDDCGCAVTYLHMSSKSHAQSGPKSKRQ